MSLVLAVLLSAAACSRAVPTLQPTPTSSPEPIPTPSLSAIPRSSPQAFPPTTTVPAASPTAVPVTTTPATTPSPTPPTVRFSANGQYAFPVAGDLELMTWTHYHWDGSNAVDIEAARDLTPDSTAFQSFIQLPVVAVVSGTVAIADNVYGGLALLLHGQDGNSYYYGHLSEQWATDGQSVSAGDLIGRIGNTGLNTQYIEPHLHFSIASHDWSDWRWEPDVNAAEQLLSWFDLSWQDLNIADYPIDRAAGWPLAVPAQITRPFSEPLPENPDQPSIDIAPLARGPEPIPVFATLGGEVNVNRATVMGLRAQITNRPARTTVVYSFLLATTVSDGDVVQHGDVVGYMDPREPLNYMLFVNDLAMDPAPTLGDAPNADGP